MGDNESAIGGMRSATELMRLYSEAVRREAELRARVDDLVAERTTALAVAKEMAETANRAKNAFLANMSHELRTPLSAIIGMNELALRRATDPRQKEHLQKVAQASRHLLALIDEILDLSRIEAGRMALASSPFRLASLLRYVTDLTGHKALAKGLELVVDAAPGLEGTALVADPLRLSQVLLNLLGNAVKFTGKGSVVLRVFALAETPDAITLRFEVSDTGIGISLVDQQRLFIAFEQADASLARSTGGAGLGLMISKRLVQAMGGEIGVQSTYGQGSTFWIRVRLDKAAAATQRPLASAGDAAEPASDRLRAGHRDARVLLVEDDPTNQLLAVELMAAAGIQADVAADGAAAVELVRRGGYDLVLMDMRMPGMNGVDATRAIRAMGGFEQLPIIAITANVFEADRWHCQEAGMNDFISKPVEPELLYATLLRWLDRRARLST